MKRAVIAALLAAFVFAPATFADDDWVNVSAGKGTFRFSMPTAPTTETTKDTEDGVPLETTVYTASNDAVFTFAIYTEYKSDYIRVGLNIVISALVKGLEADLISNTPMPYERGANDILEGALVELKKGPVDCKARIAVDRIHIYALVACVPNDSPYAILIDRALASFEVTAPKTR